MNNFPSATVYFIADNQERELFGDPTYYSAGLAQTSSKVAIRSVEQDLYTKYVAESVMRTITNQDGTPPVIHLGDVLDYSCNSEFSRLRHLSFLAAPNVYVVRGNHDGIFQGNMTYGGWLGRVWLYMRKIFVNKKIDTSLESHFNAVCGPLDGNLPKSDPKAPLGRDKLDAREWPHQFNCDYLRLKSSDNLENEIKAFCDASDYHRYYKVPEHGKPPPLRKEDKKINTPYEYKATMTSGNSLMKWNRGSLLQSVRVPLKPSKECTNSKHKVKPCAVSNDPELGLILLDTTDWPKQPSFKLLSNKSSSKIGTISKHQRTLVENQLKEWQAELEHSVKAVILTGHYPLSDLHPDSVRWMLNLQDEFPFLAPVYFSAHTHQGYTKIGYDRDMSNGDIREINVGSLIDAPVHYRKAIFSWDDKSSQLLLTSELRTPWKELQCAADGSPQAAAAIAGKESAVNYKKRTDWRPTHQWCERLWFAGRSMRDLAGLPVDVTKRSYCVDSKPTAMSHFLKQYRTAQETMNTSLIGNIKEQERLACAAIAGGKVFTFNKKDGKEHEPPGTINYVFDLRTDSTK
ncbi:metallophosphoesterase family protein [Halioxenophilus aromaticivorans]|uniref:Calcineurin-like phosphoesterase domain-containing protein n=1 Tax=Halioxenophilus aromaticivorans TaxID=1306992 RepID=A0AAV3TXA8_9ALTE